MIIIARTPQDPKIRITEILDTAESLFYTKGYHETAISDIVKKMGVAQGTLYYYFKSKEEILEELIKRQMSLFIAEIKTIACSDGIAPPRKMELTIYTLLEAVRYKDGLLLDFLYNDQYLHIMDKLSRQGKLLLAPWLLKIIEEGADKQYFHLFSPKTSLDFIQLIIQSLVDIQYEKAPAELLAHHSRMAESLIEKALGASAGTIHLVRLCTADEFIRR